MQSLAHKFVNLGGGGGWGSYHGDGRPSMQDYTGLNLDSPHAQDLLACWPMWGPSGADVIVDLVRGVTGYRVNAGFDPYVYDDAFGWVYQGDNGGTPHGGGAAAHSSGYQITQYPWHLDRGYSQFGANPLPKSISFTAWYRGLDAAGQKVSGADLTTANVPPNAYFCTFDSPANSFPGFGFAVAAPAAANVNIMGEVDIDGAANQATIIGQFGVVNDGQWHHITGVYQVPDPAAAGVSGGQGHMQLYIDGLIDTSDLNGAAGAGTNPVLTPPLESPLTPDGNGTWKFYIGVDDDGTSAAMNGRFCDLRIYGTDLTATEALHMWSPDTRWDLYRPKRYYAVWQPPLGVRPLFPKIYLPPASPALWE